MITRAECVDHRLVRRGEQTPASVAIVAPGRTPLTSLALSREIRTIGARLNAVGVRRRDRIAIVLPTGPDMAVTCLGVAACATSAPLNPAYLTNELEFYLSDLKAAALVTSSTTESPAREVADALHIPVLEVSSIGDAAVGGDAAAGVFDLRGPSRAAPGSGTPADPDDVALVLHTSGTTSRPKIVPLTHANLCLAADNMTRALALRETDRCLNVAHLFRLVIVPSIPTGPSGKYQRRALAEQLGLLEPTGASRSGRVPRRSVPALDLLEAQLTQIWESLFGTRPIGVTDDFFHLGGHSLLAARMLDEVEQVCGWTVPPSTLYAAPTIELLAHQLMARRGATDSGSSLVAVQAGGSRPPFVLLHGDLSGVGSYCRSLAGHLGPDQPFYVLPPHGSNGDEAPPTIEVMAEDFLAKVRAAFPDGRYILGGFSNGGLVAFEMARRLQARGKPIPLLVVIDMPVEHPRWRLLRGPIESLGRLRGLDAAGRRDLFRLWKYRVKRVRGLVLAGPSAQVAFVLAKAGGNRRPMAPPSSAGAHSERQLVGQRWRHMLDTYDPIIDAYVPQRYPGRIALIASADRAARFPRDPTMGWGRVARKVRVLSVPGEHLTCVTTHGEVLAERLRVCLDEVRS